MRGRIKELGITERELAKRVGMSEPSMYNKLNGKTDWTLKQIKLICQALKIPNENVYEYFFTD